MLSAPCKDCKARFFGCHSKCESYISFRKEKDKENEKRMSFLKLEHDIHKVIDDGVKRRSK